MKNARRGTLKGKARKLAKSQDGQLPVNHWVPLAKGCETAAIDENLAVLLTILECLKSAIIARTRYNVAFTKFYANDPLKKRSNLTHKYFVKGLNRVLSILAPYEDRRSGSPAQTPSSTIHLQHGIPTADEPKAQQGDERPSSPTAEEAKSLHRELSELESEIAASG